MKSKVLLLALATAFAFGTNAQEKTTFGVRAGVNFTNFNGEDENGKDLNNDLKTGFNIGVNAEIPVASDFYLQPGLLFSTKGYVRDIPGTNDDFKWKVSYLEIPINFLYKPALGPGKLLLGFGPYIGLGVGGKATEGDDEAKIKFKSDLDAEDLTKNYWYQKGLDFGGNFLAGYELSSKISFQLNAQLGMANLVPKVGGRKLDSKWKNTGFGFSVGYRF